MKIVLIIAICILAILTVVTLIGIVAIDKAWGEIFDWDGRGGRDGR